MNTRNHNNSTKIINSHFICQILIGVIMLSTAPEAKSAPTGKLLNLFVKNNITEQMTQKGRRAHDEFLNTIKQVSDTGKDSNGDMNLLAIDRTSKSAENTNMLLVNQKTNLVQGLSVDHRTSEVTRFALYAPKLKNRKQGPDIKFSPNSEAEVYQYSKTKQNGNIEISQVVGFEKIGSKYYKQIISTRIKLEKPNATITASLFDTKLISVSIDIANQPKLSTFFTVPDNIKGEVTQVNINKEGTRLSFITSEGKQYNYMIQRSNSQNPKQAFTFEQEMKGVDPKHPEKGTPLAKDKLDETFYADVKVYPGQTSVAASTVRQIDMGSSTLN